MPVQEDGRPVSVGEAWKVGTGAVAASSRRTAAASEVSSAGEPERPSAISGGMVAAPGGLGTVAAD
jgi:hypothetical protein